jgi:predicted nuclease of predicted toxin-antitoxin system
MRILLDACVPNRLRHAITGHDVSTARQQGWSALPDGELLDRMEGRFDVLVTVDRNLPFQQRLQDRPFAVVILRARSNRLTDLLPLVPALTAALAGISPGETREIDGAH